MPCQLTRVAVLRTLQAGHDPLGAVGAVAAHRDAVAGGLAALLLGPGARGAGLALALPGLVLVGSLGAEGAALLALAAEEAGGALQASA